MKCKQGSYYDGQWLEDKKEGHGVYRFNTGAVYEGEWHNNLRHGKGVFKLPEGPVFEGEWHLGVQSGACSFKWPNGDLWEGFITAAPVSCRGKKTQCDGATVLEGQWEVRKCTEGLLIPTELAMSKDEEAMNETDNDDEGVKRVEKRLRTC